MSETFNRANPFYAFIKERYSLCKPGTSKETTHTVIDIAGSGITYEVGDSVAVLPSNDPQLVEKLLARLELSGRTLYCNPKNGEKVELRHFLLNQANLSDCSPKFLEELCKKQNVSEKKTILEHILQSESSDSLKQFQKSYDILSALELNPEVVFDVNEFCGLLKPMMPRFYSIASSQKAVGDEIHLTVALQRWNIQSRECFGVCTHFLCDLVPMNAPVLPIYIHPHRGFTLPKDPEAPVIMIGPGTGVAPFRGFMQERDILEASGKNWLFFGEWNREHHYFYEDFWSSMEQKGKIRLDVAFSRDQKDKIYVQHRMLENGKELFQWLQEGAYLYVCGDASRMAKDVEEALHLVLKAHGNLCDEKAKAFIKTLRQEKRYLRDVY